MTKVTDISQGIAYALKTASAAVAVSAAAAPSAGQILKAMDATDASWATNSGDATQAFAMLTAAAGTNTTQGASTAFVQNEFGRHDNICLNGGFTINQTGYVSGSSLSAGTYGHDQWKAGASGGDYSFTQLLSDTIITIASSKSLIQIIEASHVQFTSYVLAWTGTAQARYAVNGSTPGGSYTNSPIVISGQAAGTKMSIEFNSGTVGTVILSNSGTANRRMPEQELALCQRYYFKEISSLATYWMFGMAWTADINTAYLIRPFPVRMYSTPTLEQTGTATDYGLYTNSSYVCSGVPVINGASTPVQALIQLTFAGALTANQVGFARANGVLTSYLGFAARLT